MVSPVDVCCTHHIEVSLIVATVGRYEEVESLLSSLRRQTVDLNSFEVIIVDQNDGICLDPIVERFINEGVIIEHVKVNKRGLSFARNMGLLRCRGRIIGFPDDDCVYYDDTIENVLFAFREDRSEVVIGRLWDRGLCVPIFREWPRSRKKVTYWNFYRLVSSVTLFSCAAELRFDESLGAGAVFGSNEDADYIYRVLRSGGSVMYTPSVEVWHPEQADVCLPRERVKSYGLGFGAFCRRNWSLPLIWLMVQVLVFHFVKAVQAVIQLRLDRAKMRVYAVWYRLVGIFVGGL